MAAWFRENALIINFVYGLSFFSLGLVVSVQPWMYSRYRFARELWALAAFAFLHAFADWGLLFIPLHAQPEQSRLIAGLWGLRTILAAVSFGCLLHFGVQLLGSQWRPAGAWAGWIAPLLTGGWLGAFFVYPLVRAEAGVSHWYWVSEVWSRYMLGLPAGLATAAGLFGQREELRRAGLYAQVRSLKASALFFTLYGLTAGLVVRRQPFWPASVINSEAFLTLVGIPVELVRTATSVGAAFSTVRLMGIFTVETAQRLYQSEEERAIFRERERIARELHDGMLQTLYGVGLGLRELAARLPAGAGDLQVTLNDLTAELGGAITDLRRAITNLREDRFRAPDLLPAVRECVRQVTRLSHLQVDLKVEGFAEGGPAADLPLPAPWRDHVLAFLREGLSNVVRHAGTRRAAVMLALQEDTLILRISDDGVGFEPAAGVQEDSAGSHHGLRNLASRAAQLGGTFRVDSAPGRGTRLLLHIPIPTPGGAQP